MALDDQRQAWRWSILAVLISMAATVFITHTLLRMRAAEQKAQFERQSALTVHAVRQQLLAGGQMLRAIQSSYSVAPSLSQQQLEQLYFNLSPQVTFPAGQAVTISFLKEDKKAKTRRYVTTLVAPLQGNERLRGLDLAVQPKNLWAVLESERRHNIVMSEPFTLYQDQGQPGARPEGVAIRLPAYDPHGEVVGSIAASFRVSDLIEAALPEQGREYLIVELVDVTDGQRFLLYSSGKQAGKAAYIEGIDFGTRLWKIVIYPKVSHGASWLWPWLLFAAGGIISMLLGFAVYTSLCTRFRAVQIAREMTVKFRHSEERFRLLNENLPGLVILADASGKVTYANRTSRERLVLNDENGMRNIVDVFGTSTLLESLSHLPSQDAKMSFPRMRLFDKRGKPFWASLSFSTLEIEGEPHILALGSDISEIMEMSEQIEFQSKQLQFQATHDDLTGLLNRRDFEAHLEAALTARDGGGMDAALLYIDLDQFKVVNDTSGHLAGDKLLVQVAEQLRSLMGPHDVLARLGGDEFGVLHPAATLRSAEVLAERVRQFFEEFEFQWKNSLYQVTCSMGITLLDRVGMTKEEVMSRADTACYMAKEQGRNRWQVLSEGASDAEGRRLQMEWVSRIRRAVAESRLQLYYQELQPLVAKNEGVHFELLLRMIDEQGEIVPAGEFIPAAERYGLMPLLDRWVVNTALSNFDSLHPSPDIGLCAINLSGDTVDNPGFENFLMEALQRHQVDPSKICFEITETTAIRNMERAVEFIPRLRSTGCKLALDDFGAGMSSFGYLKQLKVDYIKVDGSFIRDIEHDGMSHAIVRAVSDIAQDMHIQVIAEWVASQSAIEILKGLKVAYGQGFFLHRPAPCPILTRPEETL